MSVRSGRRWRVAVVVPLLALGLPTTTALAAEPAKKPRTFDTALEARTSPDGTLSKKVALAAFEASWGSVPGAKGKPITGRGIVDGTLAVNAVLAHWSELSPAQQQAIQRLVLGTPKPLSPVAGGPGRRVRADDVEAVDARVRDLVDPIRSVRDEIAANLGRTLTIPIQVREAEIPGGSEAGTIALDLEGKMSVEGTAAGCNIAVTESGLAFRGAAFRSILAHEVFHCFQLAISPLDPYFGLPAWIVEGSAAWVGETIAGGSRVSAGWWDAWLLSPTYGLFSRTYPAIGFYAVLDANGRDPWSVFDPMLLAGGSRPAYDIAARGAGDAFLTAISKTLVRVPALGAGWESSGPGITGAHGAEKIRVTPETTAAMSEERTTGACGGGCAGRPVIERSAALEEFGFKPYALHVGGDILQVATSAPQGAIGFSDGSEVPITPGVAQSFCLAPGGCTCEDGGAPLGGAPLAEKPAGDVGLALVSHAAGTITTAFAALTLDHACAAGSRGLDRCLLGRWRLDVAGLEATLQERLGASGAAVTATGGGELRFRAGTYESNLDLVLTATREIPSVGEVTADVSIRGGGTAHWTADGLTFLPSDADTHFDISVAVRVGDRTLANVPVPIPGAWGIGEGLFEPISYACTSEDRLVMTPPGPGGYPVPFIRVH